jgi:hypothetical protein
MREGTLLQAKLPTIDEIRSAAELIYRLMPATPQYRWPLLAERVGTEVWLKHENQTPTGAFKARTAVVYVDELIKRDPATRGLITATRGNHGQSVALAAQRFGIPATIVVPHGNSPEKNAAMRAQGATLIEFGADYQSAREKAVELAREQQLHMVLRYRPRCCHLLAGTVFVREGYRCGLCANWDGLGNLLRGCCSQRVRLAHEAGWRGFGTRAELCRILCATESGRDARYHAARGWISLPPPG